MGGASEPNGELFVDIAALRAHGVPSAMHAELEPKQVTSFLVLGRLKTARPQGTPQFNG